MAEDDPTRLAAIQVRFEMATKGLWDARYLAREDIAYLLDLLAAVERRHQEERVHLENQIEGLKLDWAMEHLARMRAEAALQTPQEETT